MADSKTELLAELEKRIGTFFHYVTKEIGIDPEFRDRPEDNCFTLMTVDKPRTELTKIALDMLSTTDSLDWQIDDYLYGKQFAYFRNADIEVMIADLDEAKFPELVKAYVVRQFPEENLPGFDNYNPENHMAKIQPLIEAHGLQDFARDLWAQEIAKQMVRHGLTLEAIAAKMGTATEGATPAASAGLDGEKRRA